MNARAWSRRRMARFTSPVCKAFLSRTGGRFLVTWDPEMSDDPREWATPEEAYWSTTVWAKAHGTPERPEGSESYRLRNGVRGGQMVVAANEAWERKIYDWLNESVERRRQERGDVGT